MNKQLVGMGVSPGVIRLGLFEYNKAYSGLELFQ